CAVATIRSSPVLVNPTRERRQHDGTERSKPARQPLPYRSRPAARHQPAYAEGLGKVPRTNRLYPRWASVAVRAEGFGGIRGALPRRGSGRGSTLSALYGPRASYAQLKRVVTGYFPGLWLPLEMALTTILALVPADVVNPPTCIFVGPS